MEIFYDHIRSCVVLCDPDHEIFENELNIYLIDLMDNIEGEQQKVDRTKRIGQYLLISGHANLRGQKFFGAVKTFLENHYIDYQEITGPEISQVDKNQLIDISTGESGGGVVNDTEQIERGIEPLVYVLNEFNDIQTFASCEGHHFTNQNSIAYVIWTASSLKGLNYSTFILKNAINEVWEKFSIEDAKRFGSSQTLNKLLLTFHTSLWDYDENRRDNTPVIGENFYKFTFSYQYHLQENVFDIIKNITECIKLNENY